MTPRILYLGNTTDFDVHTARMLLAHLRETTGNRALYIRGGLLLVHPKGDA